jgi:hypothetical protein
VAVIADRNPALTPPRMPPVATSAQPHLKLPPLTQRGSYRRLVRLRRKRGLASVNAVTFLRLAAVMENIGTGNVK